MATIQKTLSGGNQAPTLKLTITPQAYNVEANTTPVAYSFEIERPSNVNSSVQKNYSVSIGGQLITGKATIGGSGTKVIKSGTVTIKHNPDGTKMINYSFSMAVEITWSGTYNGTVAASGNLELPAIPRATQPSVNVEEAFIGDTITISMPRASVNYTHNLKLQIGAAVIQIGTGYGVSASYILPASLNNYITESTSYEATIWCETYQGTTHIGSKSCDILLKVPTSIAPSITAVTTTELNTAITIGELVQGYSKIAVNVTAAGIYNSVVKLITATMGENQYQGAQFETETLLFSGNKDLVVKAKDSRGRTTTYTKQITVLEYYNPEIETFKVERCDSDGTLNESGEYAKITFKYKIAPLNSKNTKSVKIEYKNGDTYTTLYSDTTNYTQDTSIVTTQTFTTDSSFEFRMTVTDSLNTATANAQMETDKVTFDIHSSGQGMALGKVAETQGLFDVDWDAKFRKDVAFKDDTEWTELTLETTWKPYNNVEANKPKYRIVGRVVEIRGAVSPVTAYTSAFSPVVFAQLPDKIKPESDIFMLCAGGNKETWTLVANSNGLGVAQYGTTSYGTVGTSSRLAFQLMYTI